MFALRKPVAGKKTTRRAPRVIVVHGDAARASACCDALRIWGFDPCSTDDGEKALWMVAEMRPVAVVIDLELPRVDPLDVTSALRAHERTRDVAIIALAKSLEDDLVELATQRGCDTLLAEPHDGDEIATEVERLTSRRRRAA